MENFRRDDLLKELLQKYMPIIRKMQTKYCVQDFMESDWLQEALIVLDKCCKSYDETKNVTFGVYFKTAFEHTIISRIRKEHALKRIPFKKIYSLDEIDGNYVLERLDFQMLCPIEDLTARMILCEQISHYTEHFSKFEQEILLKKIMEQTNEEIAKHLGVSERIVRVTFAQILKKIRKGIN